MNSLDSSEEAIELLQKLGLKEYESRTFVALTRLHNATAKDISDHSSVPRTRVYDAVSILESKGLVETQHSTPQQFRAVGTDEAVKTLEKEYQSRTKQLEEALREVTAVPAGTDSDDSHEVWALAGSTAIENRTERLINNTQREVFLLIGHEATLTPGLKESLQDITNRGARVLVGTPFADLRDELHQAVSDADVFVSGIEWLQHSTQPNDDVIISRLLLADKNTILVGTLKPSEHSDQLVEQAIFGQGYGNGVVTIIRRLLANGQENTDSNGFSN